MEAKEVKHFVKCDYCGIIIVQLFYRKTFNNM